MKLKFLTIILISLAAISACSSDEGTGRRQPSNGGNGGEDNVTLQENKDWTLTYNGRSEIVENGSSVDVENFAMKSSDTETYFMDVISAYSLENDYGNSLLKYFNDELEAIENWAEEDNAKVSDYLYSGNQTFQFDRMRSGDWVAVSFGIENGEITGSYTVLKFSITEETPTAAYNKWLGNWSISDGKTSYDVTLSKSEANYAYTVSGWESGASGNKDAEKYTFETFFNRWTGSMVFYGQWLDSFTGSDNNYYDVCLLGNIYYPGGSSLDAGSYVLTDYLNIAEGVLNPAADSALVTACGVNVYISDSETYGTSFTSMQFYDVSDSEIYPYNDAVPQFPLKMAKKSGATRASYKEAPAPVGLMKAVRHNPDGRQPISSGKLRKRPSI